MTPEIYFWTIHNNKEKCQRVCELVYRAFSRSQRVLILTPNGAASEFVSQLLWHMPPDQYIPHTIVTKAIAHPIGYVPAAIVITTRAINFNRAHHLIQLCPEVPKNHDEFACIHELDDRSDPEKERATLRKKEVYKNRENFTSFALV